MDEELNEALEEGWEDQAAAKAKAEAKEKADQAEAEAEAEQLHYEEHTGGYGGRFSNNESLNDATAALTDDRISGVFRRLAGPGATHQESFLAAQKVCMKWRLLPEWGGTCGIHKGTGKGAFNVAAVIRKAPSADFIVQTRINRTGNFTVRLLNRADRSLVGNSTVTVDVTGDKVTST
jgi:hypothetical protein